MTLDNICEFLARCLPRRLVYWAVLRAGVYATTGQFSHQEVPALSYMTMLKRWDDA